jgi:hypothetical protein
MLVLIDESGDAGFKLDKGSSKYFVLTAVIFDDNLQAEKTAVDLKLLRQSLKFDENYEFHFNSAPARLREAFLKVATTGKFRTRAIVFDKSKITSRELQTKESYFYNYALKLLLKDPKGKIKDASIKLDGKGDRVYKRAAGSYLRQELNSPVNKTISKLKFVDSKADILIQLADMMSGAIYYSYRDIPKANVFIKIVKNRVENIWVFDSR